MPNYYCLIEDSEDSKSTALYLTEARIACLVTLMTWKQILYNYQKFNELQAKKPTPDLQSKAVSYIFPKASQISSHLLSQEPDEYFQVLVAAQRTDIDIAEGIIIANQIMMMTI